MHLRRTLTTGVAALAIGTMTVTAASAAHTGKKIDGLEFSTQTAIERDDSFGALEGASGTGGISFNIGKGIFCIDATFEGKDIEALHVHEKADGSQSGPVVVQLSGLLAEDGLSADGCVDVDREVLRGIASEKGEYYINAHDAPSLRVIRTELPRN